MAFTFSGGVHLEEYKELSKDKAIENCLFVPLLYVPLNQHAGTPAESIVKPGETVKKGQLIAKAQEGVSANIFSPVSGKVSGIVNRPDITGKKVAHIQIENDGLEDEVFLERYDEPTREQIVMRIREAGIVGMGGAAFPSHIKIAPPEDAEYDTLLINGAECEPYITCDYRLMLEYTEKLVKGVELVKRACGAKHVYICVEDNKKQAIEALLKQKDTVLVSRKSNRSEINSPGKIKIVQLKSKYPQGSEKQLIYAAVRRRVPEGRLPSAAGCLVTNVHTALSVYFAVTEGKPLYERVITVSGGAAKRTCNIWVKTGTPIAEIEKHAGTTGLAMIISGGPMMGSSVHTGDVCVTKATGAILFLTKEELNLEEKQACIGCGKCINACPMKISPMMIDIYALNKEYSESERFGALQCIECGCCSYICPAKRPLVQSIRVAKNKIREMKTR